MTHAPLKDVIAYVLQSYPHKSELSNARVTKIIYLADWHQAINHGHQITGINWYFDNYGPFVKDVKREVDANPSLFKKAETINMYGQLKNEFNLKDTKYVPQLNGAQKMSIDHIIQITKSLNWNDFIKLVYATHPVASSSRYSPLNLIQKAAEYNAQELLHQ